MTDQYVWLDNYVCSSPEFSIYADEGSQYRNSKVDDCLKKICQQSTKKYANTAKIIGIVVGSIIGGIGCIVLAGVAVQYCRNLLEDHSLNDLLPRSNPISQDNIYRFYNAGCNRLHALTNPTKEEEAITEMKKLLKIPLANAHGSEYPLANARGSNCLLADVRGFD